jgi:hypothetical protein
VVYNVRKILVLTKEFKLVFKLQRIKISLELSLSCRLKAYEN